MILEEQDIRLFYKLYSSLCAYVNKTYNIIPLFEPADFLRLDLEDIRDIRNKLFDNISILNQFYEDNPFSLTERELSVVLGWQHFIKGPFFVYKQYKKYCVFTKEDQPEDTIAYGVLGLVDPIEQVLPILPTFTDTVLLPFKGNIVYDGIFEGMPISLGSELRYNVKEAYTEAKFKYGIVTQLPFTKPSKKKQNEGRLRYYMKDDDNIDFFEYDIEELLAKDETLYKVYHEVLGKKYSKKYGKKIKKLGISKAWFALIDDIIVASGTSKDEARKNAEKILPDQLKSHLTIFQIR